MEKNANGVVAQSPTLRLRRYYVGCQGEMGNNHNVVVADWAQWTKRNGRNRVAVGNVGGTFSQGSAFLARPLRTAQPLGFGTQPGWG